MLLQPLTSLPAAEGLGEPKVVGGAVEFPCIAGDEGIGFAEGIMQAEMEMAFGKTLHPVCGTGLGSQRSRGGLTLKHVLDIGQEAAEVVAAVRSGRTPILGLVLCTLVPMHREVGKPIGERVACDIHDVRAPFLPETREQSDQSIRDAIAAKEREKKRLVRDIDDEQKAERASAKKHLDLVGAREAESNQLAGYKAEIKTYEESVTAILKTYNTIEHLRELVKGADDEAKSTATDLETFLVDYAEKVETPKRLHEQSQRRVQELERQLGELRTKIAETRARIEEAAAQGNYSQLADTEIEIEWKRRRIEVLTHRADGAKLLYNLVMAHDKQRSAALSGPVQEIVDRWLRLLTEDNYDVLQIDDDLKPAGVRVARYGADLPLTSLSHGAQEQTVVLLRLAIAVLVSNAESNLVVIDDRLVNADPIRMKRLCLILQEAAKACQIVIATCNDTPYAGLGAHTVRVPGDGVAMEGKT